MRVDQFGIGKRRGASVVVDAQGDFSQQGLERFAAALSEALPEMDG